MKTRIAKTVIDYLLSDFKNFIPTLKNDNYSRSYYYWSEDWTFAPGGMIFGNIDLGCYTVDYLFDILFNPLSWRSYIYPISPTTLKFTGKEWEEDHLRPSRGGNWVISWYILPFPIIGTRNPFDMNLEFFGTKLRLIREVD